VNPGFRDVLRRVLVVLGFGVAFGFVMLFIYPRYGLPYSILIMLLLTFLLVRAYAIGYRYRCAHCGHVFKVPLLVDYLTFSGMGRNPDGTYHTWKSLTCPSCGRRTRAVAVKVRPPEPGDKAAGDPYTSRGRDGAAPAPSAKSRAPQRRAGRKRTSR
jgi:rRNA maturation protein Nop10